MDILWDTDTQRDFCQRFGSLFVPGADGIHANQGELVMKARTRKILHLATVDDHEWCDPEISFSPDFLTTYPPHCMRATPGAEKIRDTRQIDPIPFGLYPYPQKKVEELLLNTGEVLILKKHFDAFTNPNIEYVLNHCKPERIFLFGVATDVCVKAAVEGLMFRGHSVYLVSDACAGLDVAYSNQLIAKWAESGIIVVTTDEALELMNDIEKVS
jgi:nicotinamidase/pyrazinamidase